MQNIRHEKFVRNWVKHQNATRAYAEAGYNTTTQRALEVNASRLLRHAEVQRRIQEIRRQMSTRTRITVESLLQDLADDRKLARDLGQTSAAIQATQLAARLVGLLVDRKETGAPGEFAQLQTTEEVLAKVRAELGEDAAAALAATLAKAEEAEAKQAELPAVAEPMPERGPGDTLN
jgi:hypothetical protein